MKYLEIFNDIVEIMHKDYSGFMDKSGVDNPELYKALINNDMEAREFISLVREYLLPFNDYHLIFTGNNIDDFNNGFSVRRYTDELYVIKENGESGLELADSIIRIDSLSISQLEEKYSLYLHGEINERQNWKEVIKKSSVCLVKREDKTFEYYLKRFNKVNYKSKYTYEKLNNDIGIMTLSDFNDEGAISRLIDKNKEDLSKRDYLIIDVRNNSGGTDTAYFKLLNYIFSRNVSLNELLQNETMSINYTKRNCKSRIEMLNEYLKSNLDKDTKKIIKMMLNSCEINIGKGFIKEDIDFDFQIDGTSIPSKVIVLSDYYCGSSGDSFVNLCKKSDKVTIVGRNTMGVTDYSNLAISDYVDFQFMYPTSRLDAIDKGEGLTGKGVQVDIHIPWTNEFINEDIDMKYVLNSLLSHT